MKTSIEEKITINWFVHPVKTLVCLGILKNINQTLPYEDRHILKEYEFGVLCYDYEEGLKFETDKNHLSQVIEFVKKFGITHIKSNGETISAISASYNCNHDDEKTVMKSVGLVYDDNMFSYGLPIK